MSQITKTVSSIRLPVNNNVKNFNFESVPFFVATQTTRANWIDGTSTGSTTNNVYSWALGGPADSVSAQYDTTNVRPGSFGSASLKISNTNATGRARAIRLNSTNYSTVTIQQAQQYLYPVLPNTSYTYTGWVKTNNVPTNGAYLWAVEIHGDGTSGVANTSTKLTGTNDWQLLTLVFTTASNAAFVGLGFNNDVAGNVCDAWIDDIAFDKTAVTVRLVAGLRNVASLPSVESLYFNGNFSDTHIGPTDKTVLQIGSSSDFSCGAYVYLKKKTEANSAITNIDSHGLFNCDFHFTNNHGYLFQIKPSDGSLYAWSGNASYASSTGLVPYYQWTYIIFTLTGTTLKGYVDGSLVWTQTITRKAGESSTNEFFGRENTGYSSGSRGLFGFVRDVFSVKSLLDQTTITNIVSSGIYPTVDIHWKLDEGTGGIVLDYSGNKNNGRITPNAGTSPSPIWIHSARQPV